MAKVAENSYTIRGDTWKVELYDTNSGAASNTLTITGDIRIRTGDPEWIDVFTPIIPTQCFYAIRDKTKTIRSIIDAAANRDIWTKIIKGGSIYWQGVLQDVTGGTEIGNNDPILKLTFHGGASLLRENTYGLTGEHTVAEMYEQLLDAVEPAGTVGKRIYFDWAHSGMDTTIDEAQAIRHAASNGSPDVVPIGSDPTTINEFEALQALASFWNMQVVRQGAKWHALKRSMRSGSMDFIEIEGATTSTGSEDPSVSLSDSDFSKAQDKPVIVEKRAFNGVRSQYSYRQFGLRNSDFADDGQYWETTGGSIGYGGAGAAFDSASDEIQQTVTNSTFRSIVVSGTEADRIKFSIAGTWTESANSANEVLNPNAARVRLFDNDGNERWLDNTGSWQNSQTNITVAVSTTGTGGNSVQANVNLPASDVVPFAGVFEVTVVFEPDPDGDSTEEFTSVTYDYVHLNVQENELLDSERDEGRRSVVDVDDDNEAFVTGDRYAQNPEDGVLEYNDGSNWNKTEPDSWESENESIHTARVRDRYAQRQSRLDGIDVTLKAASVDKGRILDRVVYDSTTYIPVYVDFRIRAGRKRVVAFPLKSESVSGIVEGPLEESGTLVSGTGGATGGGTGGGGGGGGGAQELSDLSDVDVPSPSDGDFFQFDSSTSEWVVATELTSDGSGNLSVGGRFSIDADDVETDTEQNSSPVLRWRAKYDSDTSSGVTSSPVDWEVFHRALSVTTESEAQTTLEWTSPQGRNILALEHSLNNTNSPDSSDHVTFRWGGNSRIGVTGSSLPWMINQADTDDYGEGSAGFIAYTGPIGSDVFHSVTIATTYSPNDLGRSEVIFQTENHDEDTHGSQPFLPMRFYNGDYRFEINDGGVEVQNATTFDVKNGTSTLVKTAGLPLRARRDLSGQTGIVSGAAIASKDTDGAGTDGIGTSLSFEATDSAGNQDQVGALSFEWTDATSGSEDSQFRVIGTNAGTAETWMRIDQDDVFPEVNSGLDLGKAGNEFGTLHASTITSASAIAINPGGNIDAGGSLDMQDNSVFNVPILDFSAAADGDQDIRVDATTIADVSSTDPVFQLRGQLSMASTGTNKITNVTDPTSAQDAATKNYVDNNAGGASSLDDLSDVSISSPATGEVLEYDGSNFTNQALAHDDLTSVGSSDHHTKYTDSEAVSAVDGSTIDSLTIDGDQGQLRVTSSGSSSLDIEDNPGGDGVDVMVDSGGIIRLGRISGGSIDGSFSVDGSGVVSFGNQAGIAKIGGGGNLNLVDTANQRLNNCDEISAPDNDLHFDVGGSQVAALDSNGNLVIEGSITENGTV